MTLTSPTQVMVSPGAHNPARLLLSSISTVLSRVFMLLPSGRSSCRQLKMLQELLQRAPLSSHSRCALLLIVWHSTA